MPEEVKEGKDLMGLKLEKSRLSSNPNLLQGHFSHYVPEPEPLGNSLV